MSEGTSITFYFISETDDLDRKIVKNYNENCEESVTTESDDSSEDSVSLSGRRESCGSKRKAEVLSKLFPKESGKIGVKITTNQTNGVSKVAKLSPSTVRTPPPSTTEMKTILTNPGHEYWRTKYPVVDQVVITDVQVDLNTITIRECLTEKGFFREREEKKEEGRVFSRDR